MDKKIRRPIIDWAKTGKNLQILRNDNMKLRRYVCRELRIKSGDCEGDHCENCKFEMDNSISQFELAKIFNVTPSNIANWESGRSRPQIEDLLMYSRICDLDFFDVVVFEKE